MFRQRSVRVSPKALSRVEEEIDQVDACQRERQGDRARTVILSTHILPEVEAICRRVLIIHRGRIVVDRPLEELKRGGASLEEIFARATAGEAHEVPAPPPGARA